MMRKVWWFNPVIIYVFLLLIVWVTFLRDDFTAVKGITLNHVYLHLFTFVLFAVGFMFSHFRVHGDGVMRSRGPNTTVSIDYTLLYKAFKLITAICFSAYTILYINFLRINGIEILQSFLSLEALANTAFIRRHNSGAIPGVTTFTLIGILLPIIGVFLYVNAPMYRKKVALVLIILFSLATFRAISHMERLALVELILPGVVVAIALSNKRKYRLLINLLPLISIFILVIGFGIFEYSRMWLWRDYRYYDDFWQFVVNRLLDYYTYAINTQSLYIVHGQTSILPYWTLDWLWQLPGLGFIYQELAPFSVPDMYDYVLHTYGRPEYNNPGGMLALFVDFNWFFIPLQVALGYMVGRIYLLFKRNHLLGVILYPYFFYCMLELPRFFAFGSRRIFFVYVGAFIVYLISRKAGIYDISDDSASVIMTENPVEANDDEHDTGGEYAKS